MDFELAKKLKEKGFNLPCSQRYWVGYGSDPHYQHGCSYSNWNDYDDSSSTYYSAPDIFTVVEWLLDNHNSYVQVLCETYEDGYCFVWQILDIKDPNESTMWYGDNGEYDTPEKAYYAAFNHNLNLI